MATHDVNLGSGYVCGMFYHAPKGTPLPEYPTQVLGAGWTEVGYISEDGITWNTARESETLKDWSKSIRRLLPSDDSPTVTAPILSTSTESLKTVFGKVETEEANKDHGALSKVTVSAGETSDSEAFLFIGKDDDDTFMLGTSDGYVSSVSDITFAPGEAVNWEATITADQWVFMKDDGQVVKTP